MRGKATLSESSAADKRITPAYAGKRDNRYKHNHDPQDHPRLCGEKAVFILRHHDFLGSPPPMRGKALPEQIDPWYCGITPAYAGKRYKIILYTPVQEDHPRLCGEKVTADIVGLKVRGSPPPMRGKVLNFSVADFPFGITPAYAGKSVFHFFQCPFDQGSPPPMRGKAAGLSVSPARTGITPAYAGKRTVSSTAAACSWDHPRLCGEKWRHRWRKGSKVGSPPPMRGKAAAISTFASGVGITPAYAGKSRFSYEIRSTS